MKETKNTDEQIRAKLENYSVTPPPHVWQQVQQQLAGQQRRTRLIWVRVAAVAAVVVFAFMAGWYFNDNTGKSLVTGTNTEIENKTGQQNSSTLTEPLVVAETMETSEVKPISAERKEKTENRGTTAAKHENIAAAEMQTRNDMIYEKIGSREIRIEPKQPELVLAENKRGDELSETDLLVIAANLEMERAKKKETENKWKMGMFLSPGYSSYSASYADEYSNNMTYSGSEGNSNVGGGFSVQYKTGKRWAVESGVYYAQNGQKSENSLNLFANKVDADYMFSPGNSDKYFTNNVRIENGNMAMNSSAGVIQFTSAPKGAELAGDFESSLNGSTELAVPDGEFSQVFEFVEIPLLVRYRLIDSRIGIELITGLNTSMVVGNNAYIDNTYGMQNVGKTADINTFNIAGTAGLGASYNLSKHFSLALEPRFSYYLNSINKNPDVDFRPYRLGVFAGMTYTF